MLSRWRLQRISRQLCSLFLCVFSVICVIMEENIAPVSSKNARKRGCDPKQWKRNKEKVQRYSAKKLPEYPTCEHYSGQYKCRTLSMTDIRKYFQSFYSSKDRQIQDAFLLKFCKVQDIKRRRPRVGTRVPTKYHTRLYVKQSHTSKLIPVCQKTFLKILQVSVHRIRRVAKIFKETGETVKEKRGGDHTSKKYSEKRLAVKRFIESFHCLESHYCRSSVQRKYVDSSLNIRRMWKMYCQEAEPELKVKESYFRDIFNKSYNIGFGSPRTDVCSKCTELDEKIKAEQDVAAKNRLMIEKRVHKLKSRAFYTLLREQKDGMVTLSFDCQKNQVLPKVPDQIAYYSRQLYIYNFAVVKSVPTKTLNNDTVILYTWTEDQYTKGSNEIASAVHDSLNGLDLTGIHTIRLVADGCGAQNKNTTMMGMCCTWLSNAPSHVQNIELVFPIPGHSFLPADRVFGNIEKEIKKKEVILAPQEYMKVFEKFGKVKPLAVNYDWKSALQPVIKPPGAWHFQFNPTKRFFIQRNINNKITIQGEVNYNSQVGALKSVLKKGQSFKYLTPAPIPKYQNNVKAAKLKDVDVLLKKHFGEDWRSREELQYYRDVLDVGSRAVDENEQDEDVCEPCEPELGLMV